ncbi:MAG: hypothetical protein VW230_02315 [Candidatus Poseidoniales archaeon]
MERLTFLDFTFVKVQAQSCYIGSDKGGWMYANQRPRYEVQLPEYFILESPIQHHHLGKLFDTKIDDSQGDYESLNFLETHEILEHFCQDKGVADFLEQEQLEARLPSLSEWQCAYEQNHIITSPGKTELLCDAPMMGNRGAMMDGRPRPNTLIGPASAQVAAIAVHPKQKGVTALTSVPIDRNLPNVIARIVLSPRRTESPKVVPKNADFRATLGSELLWISLFGIIPSFLIPIMRGMQDYAISDWPNLLFGGLVAGFVSGAIWRPRRPTISFEMGVYSDEN